MTNKTKQEKAFNELRANLKKVIYSFAEQKHSFDIHQVITEALMSCLSEMQFLSSSIPKFTGPQKAHICFQIGDWYLAMKPLLEGQHNLGFMKEKLKMMILGDKNE
jgi:hypothetical protein